MLRANLPGQVRQTHLPKWKPLLPLFEAVMNSFHAIQDSGAPERLIVVNIMRDKELDLGGTSRISGFTILDDGVGFTDENMDSFNTMFSDYKFSRGGKGLGRLLWLKAFERVEIDSTFLEDKSGKLLRRQFVFDETYEPDLVTETESDRGACGTSLTLASFREPYKSEAPVDLDHIARWMCEHFVLLLMQPECPRIELRDGSAVLSVNSVFETDFRSSSQFRDFVIKDQQFRVYGFRLSEPRSARHRLTYCANERAVVSESLDDFIPNLSGRLSDEQGRSFVYLAVVTGAYLNDRVNNARTSFDIDEETDAEADQATLLVDEIRRSEIRDECIKFVLDDLADILDDINTAKLERIRTYVENDAPHYRILLRRVDEFIDRIPIGGTKNDLEAALHRELHLREVELKREGNRIITEAAKLTDYEEYRDRLSIFMSNYNELGVAALAQYVAHRRIILDLFAKALSSDEKDGKYPLEKVLHQIIFPMRSTSEDILHSQQNLWILDERLNYHSFISSDKRLDQVPGLGSDSALRPDLLIFDRNFAMTDGDQPLTSLTVIEFKRPMRKDYSDEDNPLQQVIDTVTEIRAGKGIDANGRPISIAGPDIPTNCFVVCDITPKIAAILTDRDATATPDGQGFFGYHKNHRLYFEVMDYNKVLRDAEKRNRLLFDKLKLL